MNLKIRNPHAFAAEYQNKPIRVRDREEPQITAEVVLNEARLSRLERRAVPTQATAAGGWHRRSRQPALLPRAGGVAGLHDVGGGLRQRAEQDEEVFTLRDAKRTFNTERAVYGGDGGGRGMLYAAIRRLQSTLMKRTYATADGAKMVPIGFWWTRTTGRCRTWCIRRAPTASGRGCSRPRTARHQGVVGADVAVGGQAGDAARAELAVRPGCQAETCGTCCTTQTLEIFYCRGFEPPWVTTGALDYSAVRSTGIGCWPIICRAVRGGHAGPGADGSKWWPRPGVTITCLTAR